MFYTIYNTVQCQGETLYTNMCSSVTMQTSVRYEYVFSNVCSALSTQTFVWYEYPFVNVCSTKHSFGVPVGKQMFGSKAGEPPQILEK